MEELTYEIDPPLPDDNEQAENRENEWLGSRLHDAALALRKIDFMQK